MAKALKHTPDSPLSEADMVAVAIAFANGTDFVIEDVRPTQYAEGSVERLQKIIAAHLEQMVCEDASVPVEDEKKAAARARAALAKELLEKGWGAHWSGPVERVLRPVAGGLQFRLFEQLFTAYAVADRGVALLLDPSREYGEKLCRCRLSSCRIYFLERRPGAGKRGRTLRRYCTRAHRDQGHEELAQARRTRAAKKQSRKSK